MNDLITNSISRVKRRLIIALLLLFSAIACAFYFWPKPRVNLLVVTLDTTRADRIGCYGNTSAETPVLDELASQGVLFERAFATVPLTLPAHASIYTGLYPPEHGIRTNGENQLPQDVPTLAAILQEEGYRTGAFIASFVLDSKFGLDRGFEHYGDNLAGATYVKDALHRSRAGNLVVDEALSWLRAPVRQPFFCWVHLYDPHDPYLDHREKFGDRFAETPYDAEIAFVDLQIGRLVTFLEKHDLAENTLIVVIGDHGEGLGDHHERRHGQMVYNTTMHVPLLMSLPATFTGNRRIAEPVSQVDVLPTLLEAMNVSAKPATSGRSLIPLITNKKWKARHLYGETEEPFRESGWAPLRTVITDRWKYIRTSRPELYDLVNDFGEKKNLVSENGDEVDRFERELADLENSMHVRESVGVMLTRQDEKNLASLGYAGGASNGEIPRDVTALLDIKDMITHYNALDDIHVLMEAGNVDAAIPRLEKLTETAPDYDLAWIALGDAYIKKERFSDANVIYRSVLERNPANPLAIFHLGDIRQAEGQFEEAVTLYERALEFDPDRPEIHYNLARTLIVLKHDDRAVMHLRKTLEADPGFVFAHVELGNAASRQGRLVEALVHFERAIEYDDESVFAHMNAASVLARMGRAGEALEHLVRAAEIDPEDAEVQFQLGAYLAAQGERRRAVEHLQESLRLQPGREAARQLLEKLQP